jgi:hypothetical protein
MKYETIELDRKYKISRKKDHRSMEICVKYNRKKDTIIQVIIHLFDCPCLDPEKHENKCIANHYRITGELGNRLTFPGSYNPRLRATLFCQCHKATSYLFDIPIMAEYISVNIHQRAKSFDVILWSKAEKTGQTIIRQNIRKNIFEEKFVD